MHFVIIGVLGGGDEVQLLREGYIPPSPTSTTLYVSMRHNSLVSLMKLLVSTGCRDVVTEPLLLPTAGVTLPPGSNTADNARADVSARSIWNPFERAFLDAVCDRKSGSGSGRSGRFFQIRSGSGQIPTGSTGFD